MGILDKRATLLNLLEPPLDAGKVSTAYFASRAALGIGSQTSHGRTRNLAKMTWSTAYRLILEKMRAEKQATSNNDEFTA